MVVENTYEAQLLRLIAAKVARDSQRTFRCGIAAVNTPLTRPFVNA